MVQKVPYILLSVSFSNFFSKIKAKITNSFLRAVAFYSMNVQGKKTEENGD